MAFEVGAAGPVALTLAPTTGGSCSFGGSSSAGSGSRIESHLPPRTQLGWPGLALDRRGNPFIGYTHWRFPS